MNNVNYSERINKAINITFLGLIVNFFLVAIKLLSGYFGKSSAMIADGVHSLSDSISDVFLLFGFRYVDLPPDKEHNYGHGKIETLLTAVISILICGSGLMILAKNSSIVFAYFLNNYEISQPNWIAFSAAILSIISKEILYKITKTAGIKTNNNALIANAWHHRSDSLSSIATLIGIGGAIFLGNKWVVLDPIAAVLVSLFILTIGVKMLKKSILEMLDTSVCIEKKKDIATAINSVEGVISLHNLKTRKIGNYFAIDVHIEVNRSLNIVQAHDIATKVEQKLQNDFGNNNMISVHTEPYSPINTIKP